VIHGISATLVHRAGELDDGQLTVLHRLLHEHTGQLVRLTEQLLDLSRLETDALRIEPRRFAVRERTERLVASVAGDRAGDVVISVDPRLEALLDPDALDRILANLVTNALRHGRPAVRISAEQAGRAFRLAVEDEGPGVAPYLRPELFEAFTRGRSVEEDPTGGAGLGLAIAQRYALAHGGDISYEQGEPHGARFRVVLPAPPVRD
jgi:signal transduction histidine kinase